MPWKLLEKAREQMSSDKDAWYIEIQDKFFHAVKEAEAEGTLGRGGVLKRFGMAPGGTVFLNPADRDMAERQATERGMSTQDYIRTLLHNALLSREP